MWILYYFIGWAITSFILAVQAAQKHITKENEEHETRELVKVALFAIFAWWLILPCWVILNSGISLGKIIKKRRENVKSKTI